jgi:hypothetical protein
LCNYLNYRPYFDQGTLAVTVNYLAIVVIN